MKLAIISDDLTGALDASVVFAAAGMRSVVAVIPESYAAALETGADVVAVSLNSREGSPASAARKAAEAAARVPAGVPVFKKIDSRLKGHVRAEIEAVVTTVSATRVTLCPAIPGMGRIVKHGLLQGFGVSVPIGCREVMGQDFERLGLKLDAPDALSDADLDHIVADAPAGTVFCGARGLAVALARKMADQSGEGRYKHQALPHPMLFAIGSVDPITVAQVAALRAAHPDMAYIPAPNGVAPVRWLAAGDMIVQCVPGAAAESPAAVTSAFAESIARQALDGQGGLLLTGGETAAAVLARLGIGIVEIIGEPLPGMPASVPVGAGGSLVIITKSGGFGEADALVRLADGKLRQEGQAV